MLLLSFVLLTAPQGDVASLEARAKRSPIAYNFRILADACVKAGRYQQASGAFAKAAELYDRSGDPNAAEVLRGFSKRYETTIRMFVDQPLDEKWAKRFYTGARLEPLYGCLVGANIERETVRDYEQFNRAIGKRHATFFMYRSFGTPFPSDVARKLKAVGAGLQIAWEPASLEQMDDMNIVNRFARDAAASGIPIFLRLASEMNGPWVRYSGNPAVYRQKFRTVAKVMHSVAPNVAMVWCPNETPKEPIDSYYPGPEAVDWVGVNFYSVLYNDGDRTRSGEWRNPADALEYMYQRYSTRHPMMVGEWAATHHSVLDNGPRPQFTRNKIGQFYAAIPRLYPRVKAVHWLSMDTMTHASGARKLNNFSLLDERSVAAKYRDVLAHGYFLEQIRTEDIPEASIQIMPLRPGATYKYGTRVSMVVRSYDQQPRVRVAVGDRQVLDQTEVDDYAFTLSKTGKVDIKVTVLDGQGRIAGQQTVTCTVR
jgi:hypothetical protein